MRRSNFLFFALSLAGCEVFGGGDDDAPPAGQSPVDNPGPGTPAPPLDGTPKEDQVNETYGIFVVPNVAPGGDGTRAKPLGTIAAGLERAVATSKRLYVCSGTFNESVKVANGISMVGGFDCTKPTWPSSTERTRVLSPTSPAIVAESIVAATRVEGFEIVAPDGTDASPTSIGLRAKDSGALVFAKTRIVAGKGKDGAAGTIATQLELNPNANGTSSSAAQSATSYAVMVQRPGEAGGAGGCVGATSLQVESGGDGGAGGTHDSEFQSPQFSVAGYYWKYYCRPTGLPPGQPQCAPNWTKVAGQSRSAAAGAAGTDGTSAAQSGVLNADGFTPRDGVAGTDGKPGGGGSGGAGGELSGLASTNTHLYGYGATGPGGGAGGCPGLAGTPGKGGGASIGALLFASPGLTFDGTEIVASDGGAGGKGSIGSSATAGGAPGTKSGDAGDARAGGAGGRAGVSGSGAGGSSFGIAATGGDPILVNDAATRAAAAGAGVAEETMNDRLGRALTLPASVAGEAKDQISF